MKAVILQSGYIPWLGYFGMINEADVFVALDDVQWTTRDWRNRNRIRTPQGWSWLTVPVALDKTYYDFAIKDVPVDNSQNWQRKHLTTFRNFYGKAPYFNDVYSLLDTILAKGHRLIVDLNYELIFTLCDYIGLKGKKFLYSQEMGIPGDIKKSERLLAILRAIGDIDTYITGPAARPYLDENLFNETGIEVRWFEYHHPYYSQNTWGDNVFIPYLSVLDLIFNHGPESLQIITGSRTIEKPEDIQIIAPDEYRNRNKQGSVYGTKA